MAIISTTLCYPSPAAPTHGIFVQRRLQAIHRLMPVQVVAPAPWFPGVKAAVDPLGGIREDPPVWRPRMFYLPGMLKRLDARFYARALEQGLERLGHPPAADCAGDSTGETPVPRDDLPELVDAHFEWPDGVGAWRVARRRRLPFVCTLRGKLVSQIANRARRRQIREMLLGADALIAVSQSLAKLASEVAGRDLGVHVIPNGVDRAVFRRTEESRDSRGPSAAARKACGWTDDARYVVSVAHIQALKGWHRLVEVWPEVQRQVGDVRLVLVGGPAGEPGYERRLRTMIGQLESDAIILAGRVEPREVAMMLNAADLFVLASGSEGWCNAIAEALACGCPVVATDVGGNSEQVCNSTLGSLVPFGDLWEFREAVCTALERDWDRWRIALEGGRRDWHGAARSCVDIFRTVLKTRAGG
jgi:glycosyltransferase involved in cell wall biosynthesis